jgi:hypothetical protein
VFTWSPIAAFLAVEIEVLVDFPVPPIPVLRGIAYDQDQGQALSPAQIGAPSSRERSLDAHGGGSNALDTDPRSIRGGL